MFFVRAWHRHLIGQVDCFVVGESMKIYAFDDGGRSLVEVVASADRPQVVRIPGHRGHGTKTICHKPSLTVYFVTGLYDYKSPDEERRAWNDPTIVSASINGRADDPRAGKSWEWLFPAHK